MSRPFFGLCLLEDAADLSTGGLTFFPFAGAVCAGGCEPGVTSLMASGAWAAFSIGGSGVAFGGPTGFNPPFASLDGAEPLAGTAVAGASPGKAGGDAGALAGAVDPADGCTISSPIEVPPVADAGAVVGAPVTAADALSPPPVPEGTSWNASGSVAAGAVAGAAAPAAAVVASLAPETGGAAGAPGFIDVKKSLLDCLTTMAALVGLASSRGGAPMVAAGTVSASRRKMTVALSLIHI